MREGSLEIRVGVVVPMVEEALTLFEMADFPCRRRMGIWEVHERAETCGQAAGGTGPGDQESAVYGLGGYISDDGGIPGSVTVGVTISGTGLVACAAATERLIAEWEPDIVALVGCAGAVAPHLLPGDVVVAKSLVYYSSFQTLPDGSLNLDFPAIGFRTNYRLNESRTGYHQTGVRKRARYLEATPELVEAALQAGQRCESRFANWPGAADWPVPFGRPKCVAATIGSADQINSDPRVLEWLRKEYGIDVEECEGVAVAQVASMHGKPFVVIRGISDNELINPAYGEYLRTGKGDLGWVEVESTRNAWIVFLDMVQRLADNFR